MSPPKTKKTTSPKKLMTQMAPPRVRRAKSIRFNIGYDSAYIFTRAPVTRETTPKDIDGSTCEFLCTGVRHSIVDFEDNINLLKPLGLREFEVAEVELRVIKRKIVK